LSALGSRTRIRARAVQLVCPARRELARERSLELLRLGLTRFSGRGEMTGKLRCIASRKDDQRFSSFEQWSEAANQGAPRREDDSPVLAGQSGPRRRASREELMALVERQRGGRATTCS